MSRSNPTANNPNPSTRFFEWKGGEGKLVYYDKEKKETIQVKDGMKFLVLDQLNTVTGYNKKAKSGIYSNEVRDPRADVMVVKYFTGDTIAEGFWTAIKERVAFVKGSFAKSCYIAYKDGAELKIGNIKFHGCSLGPWFDFCKKAGNEINTKAVIMKAGKKDTSGSVDFVPPHFTLTDTTEETDSDAKLLDIELQKYLDGYFKRTRVEQVSQATGHAPEDESQEHPEDRSDHSPGIDDAMQTGTDINDDDIPF